MEVDRYKIDPDVSRFTVQAFATGMLSALGHSPTLAVRDFTGEAEFDADDLDKAALHLKIKAGSLTVTDNNISDKDRREIERAINLDVLETARYPAIEFESSKVSASKAGDGQYWVNLLGELSLHGVRSSQPVSAHVSIQGNMLRAHGEFCVSQTAYGIKPVSIGGGSLKLKDELKCSFDLVGRKQVENG